MDRKPAAKNDIVRCVLVNPQCLGDGMQLQRVSLTGLARICIDGKYLLVVNETRLKLGMRVLSPVGGALEACPDTSYLEEVFGATNFENGLDLRFRVPVAQAVAVMEWYGLRSDGRETSLRREAGEELVKSKQTGVLTLKDLEGMRETPLDIVYFLERTVRPSAPGIMTLYGVETYVLEPQLGVAAKLAEVAADSRMIYLASREEIINGRTADGTEIGGISRRIL